MTALRVCAVVLRGLWPVWAIFGIIGAVGSALVAPWMPSVISLLLAACLGPLMSIIVHECGHAYVARACRAEGLQVGVLNGVPVVAHGRLGTGSPRWVAAGGPATSFVVGLIFATAAECWSQPVIGILGFPTMAGAFSALPWAHDGRILWNRRTVSTAKSGGEAVLETAD
jgi:hypothetical protein